MNKVMNYGDSSHKTLEMRDCFWSFGAKMAPLSWNRVKIGKDRSTMFCKATVDTLCSVVAHVLILLSYISYTTNAYTFVCQDIIKAL